MNAKLALAINAETTRLRLSFSAAEIADYQETADAAERALAGARGVEHGAQIDRRRSILAVAQAALDHALAYVVSGSNPGTAAVRVGQILRLGASYVQVRTVEPDWILVDRGVMGVVALSHEAGAELRPISPTVEELTVQFLMDGGGSAIEAGEKGLIPIPLISRITRCQLIADQAGSAVVDVRRSALADLPEAGTSITGSNKPTLASAAAYDDQALDGWTPDLAADDVLHVVVESASVIERLTLVLTIGT